jgi:hypothetical protein
MLPSHRSISRFRPQVVLIILFEFWASHLHSIFDEANFCFHCLTLLPSFGLRWGQVLAIHYCFGEVPDFFLFSFDQIHLDWDFTCRFDPLALMIIVNQVSRRELIPMMMAKQIVSNLLEFLTSLLNYISFFIQLGSKCLFFCPNSYSTTFLLYI